MRLQREQGQVQKNSTGAGMVEWLLCESAAVSMGWIKDSPWFLNSTGEHR